MKFLLLFFSFSAIAATPPAEKMNYYYLETVPKHMTVMEFDYSECKNLSFDRRNSLSEIKGSKVRYVFLIGRLSDAGGTCAGRGIRSMKYEIELNKNLMTHVFVVVDQGVNVRNMEAKK